MTNFSGKDSTLVEEVLRDSLGNPSQFGQAGVDFLVQRTYAFLKQLPFLGGQGKHDAVVVPYHEQDVLPLAAEVVGLCVRFAGVVGYLKVHALPVVDLHEEFQKVPAVEDGVSVR